MAGKNLNDKLFLKKKLQRLIFCFLIFHTKNKFLKSFESFLILT